MCDGLSMKEIDAMITEFYPDRDPEKEGINFEEFYQLMEGLLPQKWLIFQNIIKIGLKVF